MERPTEAPAKDLGSPKGGQTHAGPADVSRFLDEKRAAAVLWDLCGVKIAPGTLKKLRCVGGGPQFFKGFGGRVFYEAGPLQTWGDAQRSPLVSSTSELPHRPP